MSQKTLAAMVGVMRERIAQLETQSHANPSVALVGKIAEALGCSAADLMSEQDVVSVRVRQWRESRGWSTQDLGDRINAPADLIEQVEREGDHPRHLGVVHQIMRSLGLTEKQFLAGPTANFHQTDEGGTTVREEVRSDPTPIGQIFFSPGYEGGQEINFTRPWDDLTPEALAQLGMVHNPDGTFEAQKHGRVIVYDPAAPDEQRVIYADGQGGKSSIICPRSRTRLTQIITALGFDDSAK